LQVVLLDQKLVMDESKKVSKLIEDASQEAGSKITVTGFVRVQVGEGIEKEEKDFAKEVAAQASKNVS
jgi:elongation factor Ts